jgi:hypothetical protein
VARKKSYVAEGWNLMFNIGQHSGVWFMIARKPTGYKIFTRQRYFVLYLHVLGPTEKGLI